MIHYFVKCIISWRVVHKTMKSQAFHIRFHIIRKLNTSQAPTYSHNAECSEEYPTAQSHQAKKR